jgi:predicted MFS family arabinose efflux permease
VLYIIANIALGAQNSYAGLMVLRCLQSSGISGTVALSNAAIADIITSAERGTYIGWASVGGALGPSLSPIIGGLLSQYLGYHSVFWFLVIVGVVYLIILLLLFPETCRRVVGNGSIPPPRYSRSFLNYREEKKRRKAGETIDFSKRDELATQRRGLKIPNPIMATLVMVAELETGLLLIFMGLLYSGLYAIFVGIPSQFSAIYAFSNTELGLVFLALGIGGLFAAFTQGKLLDWNYARHAKRLGVPVSKSTQQDLANFPIERARLEISVPIVFAASLLMIAYGWTIDYGVHVSAPIVILFFIGYLSIASFNPLSILIVELHPQSPGTATAAMNLVRCLLGAGATAVVLPMLDAMGRGWAYTFVGLVQIAIIPLEVAIIWWGPVWRARQRKRDERRREKKEDQVKGMKETKQKEERKMDVEQDKRLEAQGEDGVESNGEKDIEKA